VFLCDFLVSFLLPPFVPRVSRCLASVRAVHEVWFESNTRASNVARLRLGRRFINLELPDCKWCLAGRSWPYS
jgi:hypothetical protein